MKVPLFVELCAGTAALSLRLHARGARPPVSRMGAKTGYADAILRVLGLAPGARAAHYLWCEPDPGVRLLLEAYRDADLARAAAAHIRGWADEEPRALWERLRAEGPPVLPATGAEVARWVVTGQWAYRRMEPESGWCSVGVARGDEPIHEGDRKPARNIAGDMQALDALPATITPDARTVDPREVARVVQNMASNELINVAWNEEKGRWQNTGAGGTTFGGAIGYGADRSPAKLDALPVMPATIAPDAREVHPPALPPGTVCYMDPPYVGTTGYASDLPRCEVVTLARRWHAAGAVVCISEAEPIPELTADGWHSVRIDGERVGQARTFSRQKSEWLTLCHPPAWRPSVQAGLFG